MAITIKRKANTHQVGTQQVGFIYKRFYWNSTDPGKVGQEVTPFGTLPARCIAKECYVRVNSSFDKDMIIGTTAANSSGAVVSSQDIVSGATGLYVVDRYMGTYSSVDVALYIQFATSAATKGSADVWMEFLPIEPVLGSFNQGTSSAVIPTT